MELARQVGEFMTWKQVECPFEEDRAILHYLHTAPIFSEDGENRFLLQKLHVDPNTSTIFCDLSNQSSLFPNCFFSHCSPGLYLASYESESPENQVEKDRWKALR